MASWRTRLSELIMWPASRLPQSARSLLSASLLAPIGRQTLTILSGRSNDVPVRILAGPLKGMQMVLDLAETRSYVLGTYEVPVTRAVQNRCLTGMIVCDVGAHLGYFTLLFSKLGSERVFSFEPFPPNMACLLKTINLNKLSNVTLVPAAVSDYSGFIAFQPHKSSSMGKVVREEVTSSGCLVPVVALDNFLEKNGVRQIHLVKIDVEGEEIRVLQGMHRTLRRNHPQILCEFHNDALAITGAEMLAGLGYRLFRIDSKGYVPIPPADCRGGHIWAE